VSLLFQQVPLFLQQDSLLVMNLAKQVDQVPVTRQQSLLFRLDGSPKSVCNQWWTIQTQSRNGKPTSRRYGMARAVVEDNEMRVSRFTPWVPKLSISLVARPVVGLVEIASEAAVEQVVRGVFAAFAARFEMIDGHLARGVGFGDPAEFAGEISPFSHFIASGWRDRHAG